MRETDEYKVLCMACDKPIVGESLIVPVPAKGNRPAKQHMFHVSGRACADAEASNNIIYSRHETHRGVKIG
jgi:hypothetical protein